MKLKVVQPCDKKKKFDNNLVLRGFFCHFELLEIKLLSIVLWEGFFCVICNSFKQVLFHNWTITNKIFILCFVRGIVSFLFYFATIKKARLLWRSIFFHKTDVDKTDWINSWPSLRPQQREIYLNLFFLGISS